MNAFGRKLRQFKDTWIAQSEQAPQSVRSLVGFLFNADDTPRFWSGDRPWTELMAEPLIMRLPGFHRLATNDSALDEIPRRAA